MNSLNVSVIKKEGTLDVCCGQSFIEDANTKISLIQVSDGEKEFEFSLKELLYIGNLKNHFEAPLFSCIWSHIGNSGHSNL